VQLFNLVQNAGFEQGSFNGWTVSGPPFSSDSFVSSSPAYVHSGTFGLETGSPSLGYLSQTLATVPGQAYWLSFWLANPSGGTSNRFLANWNGANVYGLTNLPVQAWTNVHFFVTASSNSTTLQFGFSDSANSLAFDDVSLLPVVPAVLQPAGRTSNTFQMNWNAQASLQYQLQSNTNLASSGWVNLGTPVSAGPLTLTNPPGSGPQRFYRMQLLP
jgi:hypothetical protein